MFKEKEDSEVVDQHKMKTYSMVLFTFVCALLLLLLLLWLSGFCPFVFVWFIFLWGRQRDGI